MSVDLRGFEERSLERGEGIGGEEIERGDEKRLEGIGRGLRRGDLIETEERRLEERMDLRRFEGLEEIGGKEERGGD